VAKSWKLGTFKKGNKKRVFCENGEKMCTFLGKGGCFFGEQMQINDNFVKFTSTGGIKKRAF
jgi:hypothetical protein